MEFFYSVIFFTFQFLALMRQFKHIMSVVYYICIFY